MSFIFSRTSIQFVDLLSCKHNHNNVNVNELKLTTSGAESTQMLNTTLKTLKFFTKTMCFLWFVRQMRIRLSRSMCADCYLHAAELDGLSERETVSTVELTWCIYVFVSSSCEFPCVREKNSCWSFIFPNLMRNTHMFLTSKFIF